MKEYHRRRLWWEEGGGGAQMREILIGRVGDSVLCWGEWWDTTCSTIVCLARCFIRYVSWKQEKQKTTLKGVTAAGNSDSTLSSIWISNSLRCMPCRTCCSSRPWRFWWRVQTGGSAARRSLSRHGNSWNIWRVCLCCAASGETWARAEKTPSWITVLQHLQKSHMQSKRWEVMKQLEGKKVHVYLQVR